MCFLNIQPHETTGFQQQWCVTGHYGVGDSSTVATSSRKIFPMGILNRNVQQNAHVLTLVLMIRCHMSLRRYNIFGNYAVACLFQVIFRFQLRFILYKELYKESKQANNNFYYWCINVKRILLLYLVKVELNITILCTVWCFNL